MVFWMRQTAVVLLVVTGVLGCGCPISSSETLRGRAALQFKKIAAVSASDAEDSTCLMIFDRVITAPLLKISSLCFNK